MVEVNLVDETDVGDLFSFTLGQAFIVDDCHDKRVNGICVRRYGLGVKFFLLLILGTFEVELGSQQLDDHVFAHRHLWAVGVGDGVGVVLKMVLELVIVMMMFLFRTKV